MFNDLITALQIFGIGASFGIIGPCFLFCTPILITYIVGTKRKPKEVFGDIVSFLSGRILAYILLGFAAGLSGRFLKELIGQNLIVFSKPIAGVISILLGIFVLFSKRPSACACPTKKEKVYNFGGLFFFGFAIGVTPCAPLTALLFEIALISHNALEGAFYALFFGLGTFLSGLIVVGILSGILVYAPAKMLKSNMGNLIIRIICAGLLILLGASLFFKR